MLTITLDQTAIEKAITEYIGATALGLDLTQMNVDIKLIAGRGDNGMRAEIDVIEGDEVQPETVTPAADTPAVEDQAEDPAEDAAPEKVVEPFDFGDDD